MQDEFGSSIMLPSSIVLTRLVLHCLQHWRDSSEIAPAETHPESRHSIYKMHGNACFSYLTAVDMEETMFYAVICEEEINLLGIFYFFPSKVGIRKLWPDHCSRYDGPVERMSSTRSYLFRQGYKPVLPMSSQATLCTSSKDDMKQVSPSSDYKQPILWKWDCNRQVEFCTHGPHD